MCGGSRGCLVGSDGCKRSWCLLLRNLHCTTTNEFRLLQVQIVYAYNSCSLSNHAGQNKSVWVATSDESLRKWRDRVCRSAKDITSDDVRSFLTEFMSWQILIGQARTRLKMRHHLTRALPYQRYEYYYKISSCTTLYGFATLEQTLYKYALWLQ